nr:tobamovirus multiplication protein 1-like [Tanacetum cinerariifolium]
MMVTTEPGCYSTPLVSVNVALAFIDAVIALVAFYQVFHLMIGFSNTGYGIYFILTLVAACKNWICWSNSCGFVVMALPKILFLAAFLLLLSFWVDLCHQANDEDEDEGFPREPLLEKVNKANLKVRSRRCCNIRIFPVGSRQQVVILVTLLIFVIMLASAVLIWIGLGKNPIDSSVVARVYVDTFAVTMLLLGGALACYGQHLCSSPALFSFYCPCNNSVLKSSNVLTLLKALSNIS